MKISRNGVDRQSSECNFRKLSHLSIVDNRSKFIPPSPTSHLSALNVCCTCMKKDGYWNEVNGNSEMFPKEDNDNEA